MPGTLKKLAIASAASVAIIGASLTAPATADARDGWFGFGYPYLAGTGPTDITIDTLTFTAPTMAPPTRIILAFGGFRRPMVPASGGVCGPANENK